MHGRAPGPPRTAAAGASHQRPRGTPASAQLATNCRRPARQRPTTPPLCGQCCCCIGRAAPDLHLVVDSRGGSSPAARRGLVIRDELASDAASAPPQNVLSTVGANFVNLLYTLVY